MDSRRRLTGFVLAAAAVAPPAVAQAPAAPDRPFVLLASNLTLGQIDLLGFGRPGTTVGAGELVGGEVRPLGSFAIGLEGYGALKRAAEWSCARRTRRIVGSASLPGGQVESSRFAIRTPSCRYRFMLSSPGRSAPGRRVVIGLRDRWALGGVRGRLCLRGPDGGRHCRGVVMPPGATRVRTSIKPSRVGRWQIEFRGPGARLRDTFLVGGRGRRTRAIRPPRIFVTGDSMVQSVDAVLGDRLGDRAQIVTHALPAHGVSNPGFNWPAHARRHAGRVRPSATVVFLGAAEGFDMATPGGTRVACCDAGWVAEYARRARAMMRAYGRFGPVAWLALPAPREDNQRRVSEAVNLAIRDAALNTNGVRFLRLDSILTPGFVYRDEMRYRGRRVRTRAEDGVHLTIDGARIAADLVLQVRVLSRLGETGPAATPGRRGP